VQELVTIFVLSAGGFESTYVIALLFVIMETCKHANTTSEGVIGFAII
jgi:hypothetical protein